MSLVISTLAVGISTFNIIMCSPNEFDPVVLQIELLKRQEEKTDKEKQLKLNEIRLTSVMKRS